MLLDSGPGGQVVALASVLEGVLDVFSDSAKEEGQMRRRWARWASGQHMSQEQFVLEDKYSVGPGKTIAIYAFKAFQLRCYGAMMPIKGHKTFVITEWDKKKRDRANKVKLQNAADVAAQIGSRADQRGG